MNAIMHYNVPSYIVTPNIFYIGPFLGVVSLEKVFFGQDRAIRGQTE